MIFENIEIAKLKQRVKEGKHIIYTDTVKKDQGYYITKGGALVHTKSATNNYNPKYNKQN
tara:strand:+ start:5000 stop:5179 length:180 start_codon:yes stop_codon:yes gene_type:complete